MSEHGDSLLDASENAWYFERSSIVYLDPIFESPDILNV